MRRIGSLFIFLLVLVGSLSADLSYHLQPGDTYAVKVKNEVTANYLILQTPYNSGIAKTDLELNVAIVGVDANGNTTAQASLVRYASEIGGQVDSDQVYYDKLVAILSGAYVQFSFTPYGQLLGIQGYEALVNQFNTALALETSDDQEDLEFAFEELFSLEMIQDTLNQILCHYPQQNSKQWTLDVPFASVGGAETVTYQIGSINDQITSLNFSSSVTTPEGGFLIEQDSYVINLEAEGTSQGIVLVDSASGWLLNANKTGSMTGETSDLTDNEAFVMSYSATYTQTIESAKL